MKNVTMFSRFKFGGGADSPRPKLRLRGGRARDRRYPLAVEAVEDRTMLSFAVGLNVPGSSLVPDLTNVNGGFGFIPPDTQGAETVRRIRCC